MPGGKHLRRASKFTMKGELLPLRLNELLGSFFQVIQFQLYQCFCDVQRLESVSLQRVLGSSGENPA
jgi:hypothetical protein